METHCSKCNKDFKDLKGLRDHRYNERKVGREEGHELKTGQSVTRSLLGEKMVERMEDFRTHEK